MFTLIEKWGVGIGYTVNERLKIWISAHCIVFIVNCILSMLIARCYINVPNRNMCIIYIIKTHSMALKNMNTGSNSWLNLEL